jgi:hypothetical protein
VTSPTHADLVRTELASNSPPVEVACDESGYEGEKLIRTTTDVFAHASVRLDIESATNGVQEIRKRIRSPATEYKANHLLREKHRSVLTWLLGPSGPLHGNAHVYLIDKAFFVVGKVLGLLVEEVTHAERIGLYQEQRARAMTVTLYREGRRAFGREQWEAFLVSSNNLMRAKDRQDVRTSVDSFFRAVDVLRLAGTHGRVDEILRLLWQARPHADSFRAQLLDNPKMIPTLDPLFPAIVQAVAHWGEDGKPVSIIHDQQNTLSEGRIAQLKEIFSKPNPALLGYSPRGRLTGLTLVDSFSDSRVQLADFLAGVARKVASDELNDRGDAELTALLRPYVDLCSIWGDDRSWSVLEPTSSAQS